MHRLHKCQICSAYTFEETCSCGGIAVEPKPPKFSLVDKYGEYRRQVKKEELKQKGLW